MYVHSVKLRRISAELDVVGITNCMAEARVPILLHRSLRGSESMFIMFGPFLVAGDTLE